MKKLFTFIMAIVFSINSYSQVNFEKGYFIDNGGQRTECFIKNVDWKNNPTEFSYKLNENSETQTGTIQNIQKFGVSNLIYERYLIQIDKSSNHVTDLTFEKNPGFVKETVFLKVLVKGNSNLYAYENSSIRRFFFNTESTDIQQLVYKKYLMDNGRNEIGENVLYKQQLLNNFECKDITTNDIKNIDYTEKSLTKLFIKENKCTDPDYEITLKKEKRDLFNLRIKMGVNFSSLTVIKYGPYLKADFDYGSKTSLRPGLELEYILPFNKNKWSFALESYYQNFKDDQPDNLSETTFEYASVEYSSIDVSFGLRHYFFLNDNSKIFLTGSYVAGIPLSTQFSSKLQYQAEDTKELDFRFNPAVGLGFDYNNKMSLEFKYNFNTTVLDKYAFWTSEYDTFSIVLGYNLL